MSPFWTMTDARLTGVVVVVVVRSRPKARNAPGDQRGHRARPPGRRRAPSGRCPDARAARKAAPAEPIPTAVTGESESGSRGSLPRWPNLAVPTDSRERGGAEPSSTPAVRRAGAPTNRPRRHPGRPGAFDDPGGRRRTRSVAKPSVLRLRRGERQRLQRPDRGRHSRYSRSRWGDRLAWGKVSAARPGPARWPAPRARRTPTCFLRPNFANDLGNPAKPKTFR